MLNVRSMNRTILALATAMGIAFLAGPAASHDDELPFKATTLIIELTDNDIELQVYIDGNDWKHLEISDPKGRKIFNLSTLRRLDRQGMSEMQFASQPSHFPEDENGEIDPKGAMATVTAFLARFPAGDYQVEALTPEGEMAGTATLTHVLPALPEITAPISRTDDPPIVGPDNLVIEWEPVTTRFNGNGPVEIIEYQVIVSQESSLRATPWIDGSNRRALINLPASVTRLAVPPEFLLPETLYEFEILAIEASGNSTISVGEFRTK